MNSALLLLLLSMLVAVDAACGPAPDGEALTIKFCFGRVIRLHGVFDIRIRAAVTDGLSGLRVYTIREEFKTTCGIAANRINWYPELSDSAGTACFDKTARLRLCQEGYDAESVIIEPYDLDYPADIVYKLNYTLVEECGVNPPPTPKPGTFAPTPPIIPPTPAPPPTPVPRMFTGAQPPNTATTSAPVVVATSGAAATRVVVGLLVLNTVLF